MLIKINNSNTIFNLIIIFLTNIKLLISHNKEINLKKIIYLT
jgi:hypothetical protein